MEPGDVRIGDADRQVVIEALRRHTGAGRLTLDEFAELAGQVFDARTRRELDQVLAGLPDGVDPPGGPTAGPAPATSDEHGGADTRPAPGVDTGRGLARGAPEASPPADRPQPGTRRRFVAIMSGSHARGRWRAPREVTAFAFWGGVTIDLRHAVIDDPVIDIRAWAIMGGVDIVVPDGIPVELDGMVVMGGAENRTKATDVLPGAPLVRVHARGLWGGVVARTRRARRHHAGRGGESFADRWEDHLDDVRASLHDAVRSFSLPPPPPQPPPMPFDGQNGAAARVGRYAPRRRPSPPFHAAGAPLDLRDFLPRFLTEDPAEPAREESAREGPASRVSGGQAGTGGETERGGSSASRLPGGTLTILVTDMVGSTALAEELGDRRWWEILQAHNSLVRTEVERHGGVEVKAQGDGFLVVFPSARQAILSAVAIQQAAARHRRENPSQPVELRIGLHTGETVEADGDVFGQNVIVAVRIADAAAPGDILVSGLTRDLTAAAGDLGFDPGEEVALKGFSQTWRVHRVAWE